MGHLYQHRAPSPWAFARGEAFHGGEEVEGNVASVEVTSAEATAASNLAAVDAADLPANVDALLGGVVSSMLQEPGGGGGGGDGVGGGDRLILSDEEGRRKAMEEFARAEMPTSKDELYARLCGIFEEEKVKYIMNLHPNEIYPQKICSLILTYFPS